MLTRNEQWVASGIIGRCLAEGMKDFSTAEVERCLGTVVMPIAVKRLFWKLVGHGMTYENMGLWMMEFQGG